MKKYKYKSGDGIRQLLWGKLAFDILKNPDKYLVNIKELRKMLANPYTE